MRLAVAVLAAVISLAAAAPASAHWRRHCTRAPGDYEGGPNAYLLWTHPHAAPDGGYAYVDAGLTCTSPHPTHHHRRHIWRRWRRHAHRVHHHHHAVHHRFGWINIPIENRGGRCPKGDCDLLNNGTHSRPA